MNKRNHRILLRDKQNLTRRLERNQFEDRSDPMFKDSNTYYEIAERTRAIGSGGIGAIHKLVCKLGLDKDINRNIVLLKYHFPYWESDHVLNIAYNVLSGGTCLEDIERLRQDETYMNGLGAERIPDPTTAGDFLRRFDEDWIFGLQETINETRTKVWKLQDASFRKEAIIDVDGTVAGTLGECKEGMDIAYNGIWGYAPLIVTLANTNEVLYLMNRPGNRPSSDGAAEWMDRAIDLVSSVFTKVWPGLAWSAISSSPVCQTSPAGPVDSPRYLQSPPRDSLLPPTSNTDESRIRPDLLRSTRRPESSQAIQIVSFQPRFLSPVLSDSPMLRPETEAFFPSSC